MMRACSKPNSQRDHIRRGRKEEATREARRTAVIATQKNSTLEGRAGLLASILSSLLPIPPRRGSGPPAPPGKPARQ